VRYVVELSKAAKSDLIEITQQIALDNPSAALKLFNLVKVRCASLDQLPERGKQVFFKARFDPTGSKLRDNLLIERRKITSQWFNELSNRSNGQSFRQVFVGNYIIRYQIVDKIVQIIRIVDGRRDLTALLD
jgi:plasmid stabilization system protein ParE